jgi:hypothetical protein
MLFDGEVAVIRIETADTLAPLAMVADFAGAGLVFEKKVPTTMLGPQPELITVSIPDGTEDQLVPEDCPVPNKHRRTSPVVALGTSVGVDAVPVATEIPLVSMVGAMPLHAFLNTVTV